jgi:DNA polymerase-3 subunit delta'
VTVRVSWDVPGQRHAAAVLRNACARDDVGHAWAFLGPAGVGQEQAARTLAAALNCPSSSDGVPDATCSTCDRCARGAYPGYFEFAPGGTVHRVVDVREQWLTVAFRTALEGDWKVLRVVDADRMNEPAANAFLKALEEPPPGTVWVLDVADPDELPDTILSRCRIVRFVPWGRAELDAEARRLGLADEDRALAVRASFGSPVTLARLAAPGGLDDLRAHRAIPRALRETGPGFSLVAAKRMDEEAKRRTAALKAEGREELEALAELYGEAPPRGVVRQVEERAARREREARLATVQAALDDLVGWYRDCLLVQSGGVPADALGDEEADLPAEAAALTPAAALAAVDRVLTTRTDLELNLAQGLALEALFLDLAVLARSE